MSGTVRRLEASEVMPVFHRPLFEAVQLTYVFKDQKTFVDALVRSPS